MLGPRHITVTVQYERHPRYGRSLEWIAPELEGAPMTMTEDRIGEQTPSRTWEGTVDARTYERFARAWRLPEGSSDEAEPGALQYTLDGMNWEEHGKSPIVFAVVRVRRANGGCEPGPISRNVRRRRGPLRARC